MLNRAARRIGRKEARKGQGGSGDGIVHTQDPLWFEDPAKIYDNLAQKRKAYQIAVIAEPGAIERVAKTLDMSNVLEIGPGGFAFSALLRPVRATFLIFHSGSLRIREKDLKICVAKGVGPRYYQQM
ncbi:MAG: hypothetical protein NUV57_01750 [archaeon]|nr:hypothetical protein [archaeon]